MVRARTICLLLAFVTVLAYLPVRHAGFVVFDDPVYTGDPHVQAGVTWAGVKWAFTTWHGSNWHPLTWLSHMLDASVFGPNEGAQHFVNVLIHAANSLLLFLLLLRMTGKMWPAAFVAALFAWHPLHVESVAWISERKDVLSTFFGLLSLCAYWHYAKESKVRGPKSKVWYAWALGLFTLSLLAKPMLVTLPFVLLLLDVWPLNRSQIFAIGSNSQNTQHGTRNTSQLVVEKLPFFALTIASSIVTFLAQRSEAVVSLDQRPFGLRITNAVVAYVEYLGKVIWPTKLAVIYPLPNQIPVWEIATATALLAIISFLVCRARRNAPYLLIGWLWFLGTLVPVIGLVQVGGQALADRYMYVPSIGVFIALAYGAADLVAQYKIPVVIPSFTSGVVLVGCLLVTEHQLRFWQNSETLFTRAIDVTRNNAIAHINLGVGLEQNGHQQEAIAEYRMAIEIQPGRFQAHNNLANLLATMGSREESFREYQEALRLNPNSSLAHMNFATLLVDMGHFEEAMSEYTKAAQLDPEDPRPYYLMGKANLRQGQSAEAVKHFHEALQRNPNHFETITWLARVLAADQAPAVRNGAEAVALAERAANLTGGGQPFVLDTLAMAYAEMGDFRSANTAAQKAIQVAAAVGAQKELPELQERLQLYQNNQPYRADFSKTLAPKK